jgi:Uma2 family endonuclease
MANPIGLPFVVGQWTVQDLDALPDDGYRYEIFDGSLLVTPPPALPHAAVLDRLKESLRRQAPPTIKFVENIGVFPGQTSFYIPDLVVITKQVLESGRKGLTPAEVLLSVEVVSPNNPGNDLVLKRHAYAVAGIREYWIVDERDRTLRVLMPGEPGDGYTEHAVVRPGERWRSEQPFPLEVDPAELF